MITEKTISKKLRQIGMPVSTKGFVYIKTAVNLIESDENYIYAITKRLYPDIAEKHNTKPQRVERAIRYAIDRVFINDVIDSFRPSGFVRGRSGKMTNGDFLGAMYECLKYEEI